jgi:hypothetical protein
MSSAVHEYSIEQLFKYCLFGWLLAGSWYKEASQQILSASNAAQRPYPKKGRLATTVASLPFLG